MGENVKSYLKLNCQAKASSHDKFRESERERASLQMWITGGKRGKACHPPAEVESVGVQPCFDG